MARNYVLLDKEAHKKVKIKQDPNLAHAKGSHLVGVSIREFARASSAVPLVFIKDDSANRYHCAGVYGLTEGVNLYYSDEGWQSHFAPLNLQRYPFDVRPNGEQLSIFIDQDSDRVNEEEGVALFNEDGSVSQYMDSRQKMLADLVNSENITQDFIKKATELDLIEEIKLGVRYASGEQRQLVGLYGISEEKLLKLEDEEVVKLHRNGYLGAMYAMLSSMGQLNRLVQLSQKSAQPIVGIQILPKEQPQADAAKEAAKAN
ncbi:SapC family protein [Bowmanella dokdonensis]|uniref:SapC family protein n=1 Tax=Bowmanella dokdonensis TaxID=751969 RepID=A0A939DJY2_9ALTE|nr:SapC family protein [Bowmanella dokdonensis]MBN7824088.1 SapC family protein [Bowmanella dokdonensis]